MKFTPKFISKSILQKKIDQYVHLNDIWNSMGYKSRDVSLETSSECYRMAIVYANCVMRLIKLRDKL